MDGLPYTELTGGHSSYLVLHPLKRDYFLHATSLLDALKGWPVGDTLKWFVPRALELVDRHEHDRAAFDARSSSGLAWYCFFLKGGSKNAYTDTLVFGGLVGLEVDDESFTLTCRALPRTELSNDHMGTRIVEDAMLILLQTFCAHCVKVHSSSSQERRGQASVTRLTIFDINFGAVPLVSADLAALGEKAPPVLNLHLPDLEERWSAFALPLEAKRKEIVSKPGPSDLGKVSVPLCRAENSSAPALEFPRVCVYRAGTGRNTHRLWDSQSQAGEDVEIENQNNYRVQVTLPTGQDSPWKQDCFPIILYLQGAVEGARGNLVFFRDFPKPGMDELCDVFYSEWAFRVFWLDSRDVMEEADTVSLEWKPRSGWKKDGRGKIRVYLISVSQDYSAWRLLLRSEFSVCTRTAAGHRKTDGNALASPRTHCLPVKLDSLGDEDSSSRSQLTKVKYETTPKAGSHSPESTASFSTDAEALSGKLVTVKEEARYVLEERQDQVVRVSDASTVYARASNPAISSASATQYDATDLFASFAPVSTPLQGKKEEEKPEPLTMSFTAADILQGAIFAAQDGSEESAAPGPGSFDFLFLPKSGAFLNSAGGTSEGASVNQLDPERNRFNALFSTGDLLESLPKLEMGTPEEQQKSAGTAMNPHRLPDLVPTFTYLPHLDESGRIPSGLSLRGMSDELAKNMISPGLSEFVSHVMQPAASDQQRPLLSSTDLPYPTDMSWQLPSGVFGESIGTDTGKSAAAMPSGPRGNGSAGEADTPFNVTYSTAEIQDQLVRGKQS
ncbi:hypothetical protein FVE85_6678 [Porphyridium purpureum]|uniref:Uncharacterized protein n=1 Tax=Porphyridium purpureum TaxID=35688 RepID=A0A5J4Z8D7_PORPP|nr:hypothetical protein FVE85_6678 [Porphyridium purpureum]|eukprot:POR3144..scf295_1